MTADDEIQSKSYLKVFIESNEMKYNLSGVSAHLTDHLSTSKNGRKHRKPWASRSKSASNIPIFSRKTSETLSPQYTIVPISNKSSADDVCLLVAKRRNLVDYDDYHPNKYELVMKDSDGQTIYETVLQSSDIPWHFQQSAATHGHLGDFRFVFRIKAQTANKKTNQEKKPQTKRMRSLRFMHMRSSSDISRSSTTSITKKLRIEVDGNSSEDDDNPSDDESIHSSLISPNLLSSKGNDQLQYPCIWMDKRGKTHKAWKKRFFVMVEHELLYFKKRSHFFSSGGGRKSSHKAKQLILGRIELQNPVPIINILTSRKNANYFHFSIHTPQRIYSLRTRFLNEMIFWVKILMRKNETNQVIQGLSEFIAQSEQIHGEKDDKMLVKFNSLDSVLADDNALDAYQRFLHSQHNEEFILFWIHLQQFLTEYHMRSTKKEQRELANKIYSLYLKSGAQYELSQINPTMLKKIKIKIDSNLISSDMFSDIQRVIYNHLNQNIYSFFASNEFFRFIIAFNHRTTFDDEEEIYEWPKYFEEEYIERHAKNAKLCQNREHIQSLQTIRNQIGSAFHSPVLTLIAKSTGSHSPRVLTSSVKYGSMPFGITSFLGYANNDGFRHVSTGSPPIIKQSKTRTTSNSSIEHTNYNNRIKSSLFATANSNTNTRYSCKCKNVNRCTCDIQRRHKTLK